VTRMVDPRQPRFGQAITGLALAAAFLFDWPAVLPTLAVVLGGASLVGPRANLYALLFRETRRVTRLGPPGELEEAAPPRFANGVGFVFLAAASVAHYGFHAEMFAWIMGMTVSVLALLAAVTGLCVGCELYVLARRLVTGGKVPGRLRVPGGRIRSEA
jgi:Domain of unknown function (DUF4395)